MGEGRVSNVVYSRSVRGQEAHLLRISAAAAWAAPQKVRWAAAHFPGTRILTVMAVDKRNHAQQDDILVDDQLKHAHLWEGAGGVFVHHRDAESTIAKLAALGVPVREQPSP